MGCATVKENEEENAEKEKTEKNKNVVDVIDYGSFQKIVKLNDFGDTFWVYEGDPIAIKKDMMGNNYQSVQNDFCKRMISVFPNPTSSSATINIDKKLGSGGNFQYKLIFEEKIIYEDNILLKPNVENQIVIPAHLIQKEGTYIVAYERRRYDSFCQGTVQFMVIKNK